MVCELCAEEEIHLSEHQAEGRLRQVGREWKRRVAQDRANLKKTERMLRKAGSKQSQDSEMTGTLQ